MRSKLGLLAAALLLASLSLAAACGDDGDEQAPLKIGLLLNFGEGAAAASTVRQQSFELAIQHINDAGGVLGQPVTFVLADPTFDPNRGSRGGAPPDRGRGCARHRRAELKRERPRGRGAGRGTGGHPADQPLGDLAAAHDGRRPRLLLPHRPLRCRAGAGAGAPDARTRLRQRRRASTATTRGVEVCTRRSLRPGTARSPRWRSTPRRRRTPERCARPSAEEPRHWC